MAKRKDKQLSTQTNSSHENNNPSEPLWSNVSGPVKKLPIINQIAVCSDDRKCKLCGRMLNTHKGNLKGKIRHNTEYITIRCLICLGCQSTYLTAKETCEIQALNPSFQIPIISEEKNLSNQNQQKDRETKKIVAIASAGSVDVRENQI